MSQKRRGKRSGRDAAKKRPLRVRREERARKQRPRLDQPVVSRSWVVDEPYGDWRLDRFVAEHVTWHSRTGIQGMIEEGRVWVDDALASKSAYRLAVGACVRVDAQEQAAAGEAEPLPAVRVLHEDALLLVVDKPPGVVCHPVGSTQRGTLIQALHAKYRSDQQADDCVPRLCHRLDRDTSGVLVVALAAGVRAQMQGLFEGHRVVKEYLALVVGNWPRDYEVVDLPLGPTREGPIRISMEVRDDGSRAQTVVSVERRFPRLFGDRGFTLLRCSPITGRQHQIRVHVAERGHPVVGDRMYGGDEAMDAAKLVSMERQALHAQRFLSPHPVLHAELDVRAGVPDDLARALAFLGARG